MPIKNSARCQGIVLMDRRHLPRDKHGCFVLRFAAVLGRFNIQDAAARGRGSHIRGDSTSLPYLQPTHQAYLGTGW